jgi:serine/threonine protein kinase
VEPQAWEQVKDLFHLALALAPADRARLLDEACAGDAALRREVEGLLGAHLAGAGPAGATVAAGSISDTGATAPSAALPDPSALAALARLEADAHAHRGAMAAALRPSDRIGSYSIISVLGEGGMGVVYLAEQENPRRTVALKVIRPGIATPEMLRRFAHETQILGRLQHPGIAQIYEAGAAATPGQPAQPYFAMEFVRGVPITTYARRHELTTRQRIELFARVCDAVQHAHAKGVIHRDLKPANILIDEQAGAPAGAGAGAGRAGGGVAGQPKILDFGIARAIDSDLYATTGIGAAGRTDLGQLIGTIPYMSPEQAAGHIDEIDTRSDIYSLGVILYELLAERLPYDVSRKLIHEAVRIVREEEPARLSTINRLLKGDIETIVLTALRKEPQRRYQTAADLAADIRRYLESEPILARPATLRYSVVKFAGRHRGLVGGVIGVFVVLVLGLGGTIYELVRAAQAEELTRRIQQAMRLSMQGRHAEAEDMLVRELASRRTLFPDNHPQVVAALIALASVLQSEGDDDGAEARAREAIGVLATARLKRLDERREAFDFLAHLLIRRGKLDEADALCRERLVQLDRFRLGKSNDAAAASALLQEVQRQRAPPEPPPP